MAIRISLPVLLASAIMGFAALSPAQAEIQTKSFPSPSIGGVALDLCHTKGQGCGSEAAAAYCKSRGYLGAKGWGTKQVAATRRVGDSSLCGNVSGAAVGGAASCTAMILLKCYKKVFRKDQLLPGELPQ